MTADSLDVNSPLGLAALLELPRFQQYDIILTAVKHVDTYKVYAYLLKSCNVSKVCINRRIEGMRIFLF